MRILILGGGGREHAIAHSIIQSSQCDELFILPGNGGTSELGTNISGDPNNFTFVKQVIQQYQIEGVIVGPEMPLVNGVVDELETEDVWVFGPSKEAAQLEGSKAYAKLFMEKYKIPTASYATYGDGDLVEALTYIDKQSLPIVVKASGLAAGKGVLICESHKDAKEVVKEMLSGQSFGDAGKRVVIEEFIHGPEMSVFIIVSGEEYLLLPWAKDYKRIGEGDTGLNTGGMGAISPVPFANESFKKRVIEEIIHPTLQGLHEENIFYKGFLFIGLILKDGKPYVLEYNVRLGDPETEVILPRLRSDLLTHILDAEKGELGTHPVSMAKESCATVMLVSGGYPGNYEKGKFITGLPKLQNVTVYHAGTILQNHKLLTNGGRVMAVSGLATDVKKAVEKVLAQIPHIQFEHMYYRKDIGLDVLPKDL